MCSNIQILDDILVEEDETIEVTASFEQSEPGISLIRNTASTTITDNDCKGMYIIHSRRQQTIMYHLNILFHTMAK